MKKIIYLMVLLVIAPLFAIEGLYLTTDDKSVIQVYKQNDAYFGKIVWLKNPIDPDTLLPKEDKNNPKQASKSDPILGLKLLKNFTQTDENVWENGTIYDPDNGKTYSCIIKKEGKILKVRGFIGFSIFGRNVSWREIKELPISK